MKKIKNKIIAASLIIVLAISVFILYIERERIYLENVLKQPYRVFSNYNFQENIPLIEKVKPAPDFLLKYLMKRDKLVNSAYTMNEQDMVQVSNAIELLPPSYKSLINKRVVGIYFISNFRYQGQSEWLTKDKHNLFGFILLDPGILKENNASIWESKLENKRFIETHPSSGGQIARGNHGLFCHPKPPACCRAPPQACMPSDNGPSFSPDALVSDDGCGAADGSGCRVNRSSGAWPWRTGAYRVIRKSLCLSRSVTFRLYIESVA